MLTHWRDHIVTIIRDYRGLLLLILLMSVFRSSIADWNDVPTGSMRPTIIEGDRILINKLAYDVQLPFVKKSLHRRADPQRGDIVVFESEQAGKRLIKRVLAVPGDVLAMKNHRLWLNGQPLTYRADGEDQTQAVFIETNAGCDAIIPCDMPAHQVRLDNAAGSRATFSERVVPAGHYLVLGDNRGNSADSRYHGYVPRHEIIGRAKTVVLSFDRDRYFLPRLNRVWHSMDPV